MFKHSNGNRSTVCPPLSPSLSELLMGSRVMVNHHIDERLGSKQTGG